MNRQEPTTQAPVPAFCFNQPAAFAHPSITIAAASKLRDDSPELSPAAGIGCAEGIGVEGRIRMISHDRYLAILGTLFAVVWIALAIEPRYRADWALENVLVLVFVAAIAASYRRLPLSRTSYTLIFLFLCLHEVGAHYTYSEVPYDEWIKSLTGVSLNEAMGWKRNHFDRFAHFMYGLLMAYPLREFFLRVAEVRGFWGYFLPLDFTLSTSALFELFEWFAAELFGGDLGATYLGTQGDVWDAQKDMALASLGALIAILLTAGINAWLRRDFAREWRDSLRVEASEPLGEHRIERLSRERP